VDSNATINATILDPAFRITPFASTVVTPDRGFSFSPRLDLQLSRNHTFVTRYSDTRSSDTNSGVGQFSLLSRAESTTLRTQSLQLTETAVLGPSTINETRFQELRTRSERNGNNSIPVLNVSGAFTGGGADVGVAFNHDDSFELHNFTSLQRERHYIKF